ncbi:hypothetical protein AcW1_000914 [Taiwanofungus camphoratus]|nr:hypothetical protein AcW2_000586 [Antrodia cinnamomea]KAI0936761.1 hypothetical protein AcV5_004818 [Antrodia cinnamomea]KAI0961984.1 hypothetical protein AcV7_000933 [Antrodia cinnamomea]KAI0963984.1 hypothetical protein AcW1_000914 [Antrodia cinnamomea]
MPVTVIAAKPSQEVKGNLRFIDIGVNLTDPIFRGFHHGRKKHDDDLEAMLERSRAAGVKSMIITGGSLHESKEALELARQHGFYATVGCHPTRSGQFDQFKGGPDAYLAALDRLIQNNLKGKGRVVAVGECGLDYDRTHFASPETQKRHFRKSSVRTEGPLVLMQILGSQLALAKKYHLPLFLHSRAAHADFVRILREEGFGEDGGKGVGANGGVVHSFTGSVEEVNELVSGQYHIEDIRALVNVHQMDMGFHISVNGCSLKTADNLAAAKAIRPIKIMFETGAVLNKQHRVVS